MLTCLAACPAAALLWLQAKLNLVDPAFFPLHDGPPGEEAASELPPSSVVGANMLRYHLRPLAKKGVDTGEPCSAADWCPAGCAAGQHRAGGCAVRVPSLRCACPDQWACCLPAADCPALVDVAAVQAELQQEQPEVVQGAAAAQHQQGEQQANGSAAPPVPACVAAGHRDEWEVTFLGTGAAIPSKYRNVTGIHVNLFGRGGLLLDCGAPWGAGGQGAQCAGQLPLLAPPACQRGAPAC